MKDNKITRKIKRLELLQDLIVNIQGTINYLEERKTEAEEELADNLQNEEEKWHIECAQSSLEEYTIRLDEARKIFAELEKMA